MKEQNLAKLIGAHEVYRQAKVNKSKTKKRRVFILIGTLVILSLWIITIFGRKMHFFGKDIEEGDDLL